MTAVEIRLKTGSTSSHHWRNSALAKASPFFLLLKESLSNGSSTDLKSFRHSISVVDRRKVPRRMSTLRSSSLVVRRDWNFVGNDAGTH